MIITALAAAVFVWFEIMKIPMNSDSACMMLEAKDILSGNIFLSDRHLTGISFLTTDLPWFTLGTAVFGVGLNAFRLTVFLMYTFMILSAGALALYKANDKFLAYCVFLGVGAVPTVYALSNAFVHTAGFAVSFLIILAAEMYSEMPTKKRFAALFILTALGACGDRSSLAISVLPLIIYFLLKGAAKYKKVIFGIISGCAAGILIERLYLFIGGANLNSLSRTEFAEASDITGNIRIYIDYFLRLINARFFGKELFSLKTGVYALKILLVFAAVFVIFRCVRAAVLREKSDCAVFSLGVGFAIVSLMLVLTTMNSDLTSGRYIAYLAPFLGVVLARFSGELRLDRKKIAAVCALFFCLALTGVMPHGSSFGPENTYSRLAAFLESENLTEGYAAFWDSTVVDAYSGGKVRISPVRNGDGGVEPRKWFCKNSWYDSGNFVIVRRENADAEEQNYNYNGIFNAHLAPIEQIGKTSEKPFTFESVIGTFGQPKEVRHFEIYDILIYDRIEFDEKNA